jgi:predicted glycoside hydrolase/deacetylase ChbG (UPF0249 family)
MRKRLLLRADDLGFCEGINYGIAKTVREGLIKTVGIMPNMPAAAHGISLLEGEEVCFGQHTNICAGRPLTDPALIPSIVGKNGEFKTSGEYRSAKEDFVVLDEVILEIEAQYQRFVELTGQEPHYFEGHAVASINFFKGLEIVANRHGLRYLAVSFDGSAIRFGSEKLYLHMESMKPDYEPLTALKEIDYHEDGVDMFVCHPGYLDAYILKKSSLTMPRPMEVEMLCSEEAKAWIEENDIQLVTYDEICR